MKRAVRTLWAKIARPCLIIVAIAAVIYLPLALQNHSIVPLAIRDYFTDVAAQTSNIQRSPPHTVQPEHGQTAWSYNFAHKSDGVLSNDYWNIENSSVTSNYNNEEQTYTNRLANVRIQDGTLLVTAQPEKYRDKNYTSARVNTMGKFDFTYGTLEVTMKLPAGVGTWPAAWLLPAHNAYNAADYGISSTNPYAWALNGEIDFAEAIGSIPGQNIPAIHNYNEVQRAPTYTPGYIPDSATAFHRYGVIKTPTNITFTIDGKPYAERTKASVSPLDWPYDQPYYLIIDLALGGSWAGAQGIDDTSAPWQLQS